MSWTQFPEGFQLERAAKDPPEALVVLLGESGAAALLPASIRWAAAVPAAAFVALDGPGLLPAPGTDIHPSPKQLQRAAQYLEPLLVQKLRVHGLGIERLVLVGAGSGGTLALYMTLLRGWNCAGVLALDAKPILSWPQLPRIGAKIRLIAHTHQGDADHTGLGNLMVSLTRSGIDTRRVVLAGPMLSDEAVRRGGAYLVELVATAQRGSRIHIPPETDHAL